MGSTDLPRHTTIPPVPFLITTPTVQFMLRVRTCTPKYMKKVNTNTRVCNLRQKCRGGTIHPFFTTELNGGKRSAYRSGYLILSANSYMWLSGRLRRSRHEYGEGRSIPPINYRSLANKTPSCLRNTRTTCQST